MEAANKEAAEECLVKAQAAFRKGSFKEALRMAEKSSRMCRTEEAEGESPVKATIAMRPHTQHILCFSVSFYFIVYVTLCESFLQTVKRVLTSEFYYCNDCAYVRSLVVVVFIYV